MIPGRQWRHPEHQTVWGWKQVDSGARATSFKCSTLPIMIQVGVTSFVSSAGCESGNPHGFSRVAEHLEVATMMIKYDEKVGTGTGNNDNHRWWISFNQSLIYSGSRLSLGWVWRRFWIKRFWSHTLIQTPLLLLCFYNGFIFRMLRLLLAIVSL